MSSTVREGNEDFETKGQQNLKCLTLTFNVGNRLPNLEDMNGIFTELLPNDDAGIDIVAVGFQEIQSMPVNWLVDAVYGESWADSALYYLEQLDYVRVSYSRLLTMSLSLFVKRAHTSSIRQVRKSQVKTGLGGLWGNKGGVSIRFRLYGYTFCFVNCHLAAHDNMLTARLNDFIAISDNTAFDIAGQSRIIDHDYVLWLGDLNFRLDLQLTTTEIVAKIVEKDLNSLLEKDELIQILNSNSPFLSGYHECPINFNPTYKFTIGSQDYDLLRRPGWTDRILYRVGTREGSKKIPSICCSQYKSVTEIVTSDHKPVSCQFNVKVRDLISNLGQVKFSRMNNWKFGNPVHVYYFFSEVNFTDSDWIGLFKNKFGCLDNYLSFVYALPPKPGESESFVSYPEEMIPPPGIYQLVYFGDEGKSVFGISDPFEVTR